MQTWHFFFKESFKVSLKVSSKVSFKASFKDTLKNPLKTHLKNFSKISEQNPFIDFSLSFIPCIFFCFATLKHWALPTMFVFTLLITCHHKKFVSQNNILLGLWTQPVAQSKVLKYKSFDIEVREVFIKKRNMEINDINNLIDFAFMYFHFQYSK